MAVAFDAVGPSSAGASSTGSVTLTYTHTNVSAGVDVVVGASYDGTDAGVTVTCTIGGVSAGTQVAKVEAGSGGSGFTIMFRRAGVGSGAQTVTLTASSAATDWTGGSVSFTGATGIGTPVTLQNAVTNPNVTVTGVASTSMVMGVLGSGNSTGTIATGTARYANNLQGGGGQATGNCAGATNTGTGSVTVGWTSSGGSNGLIGVEVSSTPPAPSAPTEYQIPIPPQRHPVSFYLAQFTARVPTDATVPSVASPVAGVATVSAVARGISFRNYITGLTGTGSAGYFVDSGSNPAVWWQDETWGLPANAGRWNSGNWQADYDNYHAARSSQGLLVNHTHPWGHTLTGCNNDVGHTWDGIYPFQVNGVDADLTGQAGTITLKSTFWARIDYMFSSAASQGMSIAFNLSMNCDMPSGAGHGFGNGVFQNASNTQIQTAAGLIAARYASTPNLVWMFGDDYYNDGDSAYTAMINGIAANDSRVSSCTGIMYYPSGTTSRHDLSGSPTGTAFPWGGTNAKFNFVYVYQQTYFGVEFAYKESSPIPVIQGDGQMYGETGSAGSTSDQALRNSIWWALASGARGCMISSMVTHKWENSTAAGSITTQTFFTSIVPNITNYFENLPGWWKLAPDTTNVFVTAGRGTRGTYIDSEWGGSTLTLGSDNYVAASIAADGSLAVIYCAVAFSITIDQTKMASGYTATWVDPSSAATSSATVGSTYNSSGKGNNSAGNPDWVLVLQAPTAVSANAGVATVSAAANPAGHAATTASGVATVAAATVSPVGNADTANSGIPTSLVQAPAPVPAVTVLAGVATVTSVANPAGHAATANSGVAASAVVAPNPVSSVTAVAGVAISLAVAPQPTVTISGATNAPAGVATVASVALPAVPAVATNAGVAAVGAVVTAARAAVGVNSGVATSPAVAPSPVAAETVPAGFGFVSSVAPNATVSTSSQANAPAAVATVGAVAPGPVVAAAAVAGPSAVTTVAPAPIPAETSPAGVGTVTSAALPAQPQDAAVAGIPAVAVSAAQPSTAVTVPAGAAAVGSVAVQPTVSTSGSQQAPAGVAVVSAVTTLAGPAVGGAAAVATSTAAAAPAQVAVTFPAGVSTVAVTATAAAVLTAVSAPAGVATVAASSTPALPAVGTRTTPAATVLAVAPNATVTTFAQGTANAGVAAVAAAAPAASVPQGNAQVAIASAVVSPATVAVAARAGVATVGAIATGIAMASTRLIGVATIGAVAPAPSLTLASQAPAAAAAVAVTAAAATVKAVIPASYGTAHAAGSPLVRSGANGLPPAGAHASGTAAVTADASGSP